jgi:hypothetical protein
VTTRGQVCYEAYWDQAGGKSLVTGDPLPLWGDQSPEIQAAWEAGAGAVERRFAEQFRDVFELAWNMVKPIVISAARSVQGIGS